MKTAVAGTFNVLHDGHRALIDRAFSLGGDVFVGITSDSMASASRERINPLHIRLAKLQSYLDNKGGATVFVIDDMYGPRDIMDDIDVLVVSADTFENGRKVSDERRTRGLKPLELSVVDMVRGPKGNVICSTDILKGRCSVNGDTDALDVVVGSTNPAKVEAVRNVLGKVFGQVRITAADVSSGVPEQPFGEETRIGAENRARSALGNHDISIGIEAGVFEMYGALYDVQHCAILDRDGRMTLGMSSGFRYPDSIAALVRKGMTVGSAMKAVYSDDRGHAEGAIGVLSKGLLDRVGLTEQSVTAAMVPRIWDER